MDLRALVLVLVSITFACSSGDKTPSGPATPVATEPVTTATADAAPAAAPPTLDARCKGGDVDACDGLLERWSERQIASPENVAGGEVDAAALHTACDEHDISSACMALAMMYKYGTATGTSDGATSTKYWDRVAELGDLNGFRGAEPSEAGAQALAATQADCEGGRARACNQAGWAAFSAVQQDKNVKSAYDFYAKGCALDSGQGCNYAGHFAYTYPDDTGAAARAEQHLRKGCTLEAIGACDELGLYLTKNAKAEQAAPLFESACTDGARTACLHLAVYLADHGGEPDAIVPLFQKACEAGEKQACKALEDKGP